ncbi:unnamed protein product [Clonostachys chloroleuca]|uniref:FAD-binding FR-type domain-containing protein n=1 Tax=Clonostachys chloroleuca TaxID=1926264 RepID=A0AA35M113_9HYPO|nr:unnamed protein product [Clonostachys chloroleuca]
MPNDFERFIYPDIDFLVPSDPIQYQQRLIEIYPEEASAIRKYFADLDEISKWHINGSLQTALPWPANGLTGLQRRLKDKKATQTTEEYLNSHFKSAQLKRLLASQWGDYGMVPSESAFATHALVINSYKDGGWFPKGGSSRIARTFETNIEAAGGVIKVCKEVTSIMTDQNGHVTGVKALDLSGNKPTEVEYHAPCVVINVGAHLTYKKLLPTDGDIGRRTAPVRQLVDKIGNGTSSVTLYLRLSKPVSPIGVKGENYWINTTLEHGDLDSKTKAVINGKPVFAYMSFPSSKSGDDRFHTAEVLALVNAELFSAWNATYPSGDIYGLKATAERFHGSEVLSKSYVQGLYLTGQDAASHGIAGALLGGLAAGSRVLGSFGLISIMKQVQHEAECDKCVIPNAKKCVDKMKAVVVTKTALTSTIWKLELELESQIENRHLTLLISTRTGGDGSTYVKDAEVGAKTEVELPFGAFRLQDSDRRKVFVATGTGIVPFLPMFVAMEETGQLASAQLYFGCRFAAEDITKGLSPLPNTTLCVSGELVDGNVFHGRVTQALSTLDFDPEMTEFYLCGAPAMVKESPSLAY